MKHNKKRNTAFVYETLCREITRSIVDQDRERKSLIFSLIKDHFEDFDDWRGDIQMAMYAAQNNLRIDCHIGSLYYL